jgi:hypothetical protein
VIRAAQAAGRDVDEHMMAELAAPPAPAPAARQEEEVTVEAVRA